MTRIRVFGAIVVLPLAGCLNQSAEAVTERPGGDSRFLFIHDHQGATGAGIATSESILHDRPSNTIGGE